MNMNFVFQVRCFVTLLWVLIYIQLQTWREKSIWEISNTFIFHVLGETLPIFRHFIQSAWEKDGKSRIFCRLIDANLSLRKSLAYSPTRFLN